jgi:hypothetical protein
MAFMDSSTSTASRFTYGRKLINAGISGIRTGRQDLGPRSVSNCMVAATPDSLKLAAIGACLGFLPGLLVRRRSRVSTAVALAAAGSALGFCAGFTWKTRKVTSSLAQSALSEVRKVKDERWLERHPIDYA